VYHLELRQFPHNACHFNLDEPELAAVVLPWVREQWIEIGERKWNPNQATLTIVEGPQLPLDQLTMGRGWRAAEREGQDVTERVLQAARAQVAAAAPPVAAQAQAQAGQQGIADEIGLLADSLGLELLAQLEDAPAPLREAWRLAQTRLPGRPASESLALAERAVSSLLARHLIVLEMLDGSATDGPEDARGDVQALAGEQIELALRDIRNWGADAESGALRMRRG
jgi:hypothetical protein